MTRLKPDPAVCLLGSANSSWFFLTATRRPTAPFRGLSCGGFAAGNSTVLQGGGLSAANLHTAVNDGAITRLGSLPTAQSAGMPVNGHAGSEDTGFRKPHSVAVPISPASTNSSWFFLTATRRPTAPFRGLSCGGFAAGNSTVLQGGGLSAANLHTAVNDGAITRLGSLPTAQSAGMPVNGHEGSEDAGFRKPYFVGGPRLLHHA